MLPTASWWLTADSNSPDPAHPMFACGASSAAYFRDSTSSAAGSARPSRCASDPSPIRRCASCLARVPPCHCYWPGPGRLALRRANRRICSTNHPGRRQYPASYTSPGSTVSNTGANFSAALQVSGAWPWPGVALPALLASLRRKNGEDGYLARGEKPAARRFTAGSKRPSSPASRGWEGNFRSQFLQDQLSY